MGNTQSFDLKRFRKEKNLTQVDVADMFSCKQNFISNIEAGLKPIPPDKLKILQSKFGDITDYITERTESDGIQINATPEEFLFTGADAFSKQLIKMMNDKIIVPYSLLVEKDKEIERMNRQIGKLEAQLSENKKTAAHQGGGAICADAV